MSFKTLKFITHINILMLNHLHSVENGQGINTERGKKTLTKSNSNLKLYHGGC